MSNNTVGAIYRSIIEEVIESSRTDFEEGGVDESVLEDLRQVRCLCHHDHQKHQHPSSCIRDYVLTQSVSKSIRFSFCKTAVCIFLFPLFLRSSQEDGSIGSGDGGCNRCGRVG